MTKPSPDIFEASSAQSYDGRTARAFSYHSDARQALEMRAGLTGAKFSVGMLTNEGNLQRRDQIKAFNQLTLHFSVKKLEKLLL